METTRPAPRKDAPAGFADTPRQPDRADADVSAPPGVPPAPGTLHPDGPLPSIGRQSQRPGQPGRFEDRPGARDFDTLGSAEASSRASRNVGSGG